MKEGHKALDGEQMVRKHVAIYMCSSLHELNSRLVIFMANMDYLMQYLAILLSA